MCYPETIPCCRIISKIFLSLNLLREVKKKKKKKTKTKTIVFFGFGLDFFPKTPKCPGKIFLTHRLLLGANNVGDTVV